MIFIIDDSSSEIVKNSWVRLHVMKNKYEN